MSNQTEDYRQQLILALTAPHRELLLHSAWFHAAVHTLVDLYLVVSNSRVQRFLQGVMPLWVEDLAKEAEKKQGQIDHAVRMATWGEFQPDLGKLQDEFLRGFHDDKEQHGQG